MTFPEEYKVAEQAETELMVKSSFSDPGSFYGLMTMCAAHRAVLSGRHIDFHALDNPRPSGFDADYYTMKGRCIREMNTKMRDSTRTLSDAAFDTIVNLITSAVRPHCLNLSSASNSTSHGGTRRLSFLLTSYS